MAKDFGRIDVRIPLKGMHAVIDGDALLVELPGAPGPLFTREMVEATSAMLGSDTDHFLDEMAETLYKRLVMRHLSR